MKKIKVIFIANSFLVGGVERFLTGLVSGLDRERFESVIVTTAGKGAPKKDLKDSVQVFCVGPREYPPSFFTKMIWLMALPLILARLTLLFKKIKPDLVISSMYKSDILVSWTWAGPRIVIQHDIVKINSLAAVLKRKSLKKADKIVAVSESVGSFLKDYFKVDFSKIEVIGNGIDLNLFSSFRKAETGKRLVLGTIARLDKIKGHIYLLKALKEMKDNGRDLPDLILVGDGPERRNLESYIKENGLDNVVLVGEAVEVGEYLKKMDVFVLPSLSEGLGIAVIEAIAAGKPVIAGNVGGIKELVRDGETGILVTPGDEKALRAAIERIIDNRGELEKMKSASVQWLEENRERFDIKEVSKRYSALFEGLLDRKES